MMLQPFHMLVVVPDMTLMMIAAVEEEKEPMMPNREIEKKGGGWNENWSETRAGNRQIDFIDLFLPLFCRKNVELKRTARYSLIKRRRRTWRVFSTTSIVPRPFVAVVLLVRR